MPTDSAKKSDLLNGVEIDVPATAFSFDDNKKSISTDVVAYDSNVSEMCSYVETLDRYDDFAYLKIDPDKYQRPDEFCEYGITFNRSVHGNGSVIQPHQIKAAADMLKRLRGFGMLADVVGSGKTFEACLVLSELAVRGLVKSMLIIAPDQVYHTWKETLEEFFGLGKGTLCEVKNLSEEPDGLVYERVGDFMSPNRPLLVRWEDFIEWHEGDVQSTLFDVIVVDEAHHLCDQTGRDANALKLLSYMMQCKKKASKEYCLLLSATPHDGNLENMFNLWYFINERGGIPSDFGMNVPEERKSENYRKKKQRYKESTCYGATTVMEFIHHVKVDVVLRKYYAEFSDYLQEKNPELCNKDGLKKDEFMQLTASERLNFVQGFLNEKKYEVINKAVNAAIANAYHEGILRQIMIRQPNTFNSKKKSVRNLYFYPVDRTVGTINLHVGDVAFKYDAADPEGENAVTLSDGTTMSADKLIASKRFITERYQTEANFNTAVFKAMGDCAEGLGYANSSLGYYQNQFAALIGANDRDITDRLIPVNANESSFDRKFKKTLEILRKHSGQRVLIFFDYSLKRDKQLKEDYTYNYRSTAKRVCLADKFLAELSKLKEFKDRILNGYELALSDKKPEECFDAKEDAILIVTDANLTEGANLQSCNVIINFQVTSDPLSMDQRIGRVFRIKQANNVTIYSLADMNSLEGYVLAYFTTIGLMTSNSGDATIISGSNNENMVTLRCKHCGNVRLLTQEDYLYYKEKHQGIWCSKSSACRQNSEGRTLMREMNVHDFQCATCRTTFSRSRETEGYKCVYDDSISMCTNGELHDRDIYCRKICVISHCAKFTQGELAACPALKLYKANANVGDADLMLACRTCKLKDKCPQKCRVGQYAESIRSCINCRERIEFGQVIHCRPHVLEFNENWEADCPRCKAAGSKGRIYPRIARTFDAFINGLWDYSHKGDDAFCDTLGKEAAKVAEIQQILAMDNSGENK